MSDGSLERPCCFCQADLPLHLQSLRISSFAIFLLTGFFAIATFKNIAGFSSAKPIALFIVEFVFNAACVVIYIILQLILVIRTLDDRWPIGDIVFGTAFFVIGQVILYGFSVTICEAVTHYIDGLFFTALSILLSAMMVRDFTLASACFLGLTPYYTGLQILGQYHEGGSRVLSRKQASSVGS